MTWRLTLIPVWFWNFLSTGARTFLSSAIDGAWLLAQ